MSHPGAGTVSASSAGGWLAAVAVLFLLVDAHLRCCRSRSRRRRRSITRFQSTVVFSPDDDGGATWRA